MLDPSIAVKLDFLGSDRTAPNARRDLRRASLFKPTGVRRPASGVRNECRAGSETASVPITHHPTADV
jgi:hypothetical protein